MRDASSPRIGVLALQGAFEEHQSILASLGCRTVQVKTREDLAGVDAIILPGGESTAMGLIATPDLWASLRHFVFALRKPTWGTCAGMILLADRAIGTSAVIENGQSLIGGMDVLVCRNYFGSQISSFEMDVPAPPGVGGRPTYPGVFIRAPAILTVSEEMDVLGKVVATPCTKAAGVLEELEKKIENGERVMANVEEKKEDQTAFKEAITLPGAAEGGLAREVICAVRKENILCTAFHPELTGDHRWHEFFLNMLK